MKLYYIDYDKPYIGGDGGQYQDADEFYINARSVDEAIKSLKDFEPYATNIRVFRLVKEL